MHTLFYQIYGAGVTFFEELQKEKFTDDVYKLIQQQKKVK